ncbi:MAG TPA: DNA-3-methyladenine glycosylase I [bacterium]|nr:DNA-3-methyladenine glycosylase I [bacterium]
MAATADRIRCSWALGNALMTAYHDEEWGVPCHDDRTLFEFLILEGMQAGLSWDTILRKRDNFRAAFDGFDPRQVARYGAADVRRLMRDAGIIRNRAKIDAAIGNAKACLQVQGEFGSFDRFIWQFVDGRPLQGRRRRLRDIPANTDVSAAMSKELRRRGFRFVGPTICYAFMQAVGLVNDHTRDCFRYPRL